VPSTQASCSPPSRPPGVIRRRWAATLLALVVLGALVAPLGALRIGSSSTASLADSGPAYEAQ
jgi:RND superfamily putative drug exporter